MSILIKGVEMPQENERVKITVYPDGDCVVAIYKQKELNPLLMNEYHNYDCVAVPVPTPHGRLIDGDAYLKNIGKYAYNCDPDYHVGLREAQFMLEDTPTVIESEE